MNDSLDAPLQRLRGLGDHLQIELFAQRDDLLPFPLAGNKVRKLRAEFSSLHEVPDVVVTNGAVNSNHCRTVALMAAERGIAAHLVLHGSPQDESTGSPALRLLNELGARTSVVTPDAIASKIAAVRAGALAAGLRAHVIPGGCHSPAGANAYQEAGLAVFERLRPEFVFVACGTGATHGGLAAASALVSPSPAVIGVSVARSAERGIPQVEQAAAWAGADGIDIEFDDSFRAGGYGHTDPRTDAAVALGWSHGFPLDATYTAKAFAALIDYARRGVLTGRRVLFWHTGGLWNHLDRLQTPQPENEGD